jgi:D-alanyl-D-alanine carboxypeptidase (penicillin-binding protein 5/6)
MKRTLSLIICLCTLLSACGKDTNSQNESGVISDTYISDEDSSNVSEEMGSSIEDVSGIDNSSVEDSSTVSGEADLSIEDGSGETVSSIEDESGEADNESEDSSYSETLSNAEYALLTGIETESTYLIGYNITENKIFADKKSKEKCYPASLTKLLCAAVALEYVPEDAVFTVGTELSYVGFNSSIAYLEKGEKYKLKELIYAMLLPSGNDAAYTVAVNTARYLYGAELSDSSALEKFMQLCNEKAKDIGAKNTNFVCPDGYHSEEHYTTPYDLVLICLYSTSFDIIKSACSSLRYSSIPVEGREKTWYNTNKFLQKNSGYYCDFVTGLKTGSTTEAGKCLATMAEKDGETIIIITLGGTEDSTRYTDTLKVIQAEFGISA